MAPTSLPKPMKIFDKSMPRAILILASFLNRVLIDFQHLKPHFLFKWYWFYNRLGLLSLFKIRSIFECIFEATWHGFWSKNQRKTQKWPFQEASKNWSIFGSILYRFWLRFGSQLGAMLAIFFGPRRAKRPPRRLRGQPSRWPSKKTLKDLQQRKNVRAHSPPPEESCGSGNFS